MDVSRRVFGASEMKSLPLKRHLTQKKKCFRWKSVAFLSPGKGADCSALDTLQVGFTVLMDETPKPFGGNRFIINSEDQRCVQQRRGGFWGSLSWLHTSTSFQNLDTVLRLVLLPVIIKAIFQCSAQSRDSYRTFHPIKTRKVAWNVFQTYKKIKRIWKRCHMSLCASLRSISGSPRWQ